MFEVWKSYEATYLFCAKYVTIDQTYELLIDFCLAKIIALLLALDPKVVIHPFKLIFMPNLIQHNQRTSMRFTSINLDRLIAITMIKLILTL